MFRYCSHTQTVASSLWPFGRRADDDTTGWARRVHSTRIARLVCCTRSARQTIVPDIVARGQTYIRTEDKELHARSRRTCCRITAERNMVQTRTPLTYTGMALSANMLISRRWIGSERITTKIRLSGRVDAVSKLRVFYNYTGLSFR